MCEMRAWNLFGFSPMSNVLLRHASQFIRWCRAVALSVYTGDLAARDEQQQRRLLEV
jgi:hypothetical protein